MWMQWMFIRHGGLRVAAAASLWLATSAAAAALTAGQGGATSTISEPIVVTAQTPTNQSDKPSPWKRADADDVVVYSDGSDEQLTRITENLEKLHDVLAKLYRSRGGGGEPPPLTVALFDSPAQMRKLGLRSGRSTEGPFAKPFSEQRYYDPRPDGSILAIARLDQNIEMNTGKARSADCEDFAASGEDCIGKSVYHPPLRRSWEAVLYGAYAQHLIINYAPAAYPRWYFDGIGALFSTVVFKGDGSVEYGRPPQEGYRSILRSYGRLDTQSVLTGGYLKSSSTSMEWTPYHAGLLTHFFVLSNLKSEERAQFARYMTAIARGGSMAEAAQAFGSMKELRRHVMDYAGRHHEFAQTVKRPPPAKPELTRLSAAAAEALMARLAPRQ
jgi:hypothetical protein